MKKIWVTKYSGEKEPYDQNKVVGSILRSGIDKAQVSKILAVVENQFYDGIATSEIYRLIGSEIKNSGLAPVGHQFYRLREGLAKMGPFEFEGFVGAVLSRQNFVCQADVIVKGYCVSHQIDLIAQDQQHGLYYVEIKHHCNFHRHTDLGTVAEVWARLEDLKRGFSAGRQKYNFVTGWLVTNTKFSDHAKRYARCKGLRLTGWRYALNGRREAGLEGMIGGLEGLIKAVD